MNEIGGLGLWKEQEGDGEGDKQEEEIWKGRVAGKEEKREKRKWTF